MRNWNKIIEGRTMLPARVFSLPMRNWNKDGMPGETPTCIVFSLPMRNWNARGEGWPNLSISVFSLPMRNWNPGEACPPWRQLWRFQPTYEELKPGSGRSKFLRQDKVFSPPMRNWNQETECRIPAGWEKFSAYLWGIETFSRKTKY